MEKVRIPRFDAGNPVHRRLAELSQRAHAVAGELLSTDTPTDYRTHSRQQRRVRLSDEASVDSARRADLQRELAEIEVQVDQAAAELWGITAAELAEVQRSLKEMNG